MARPLKDGLDYFPHDTDASNDEKVEALRALYGNDGYAFFFILLERIYRSPQLELPISSPVSEAETTQILARKVAVTEQKFSQMLETALKWGCFDKEAYEKRGVLTSNGVRKRAESVLEKRKIMRERYLKTRDIISSPVSEAETTHIKERKVHQKSKVQLGGAKAPPLLLPKWIDKETWDAFIEMRGKLKSLPTDHAKALLIKDLDKLRQQGHDPNEVINQSIMCSYKGLFPLKGKEQKDGKHQGYSARRVPQSYTDEKDA